MRYFTTELGKLFFLHQRLTRTVALYLSCPFEKINFLNYSIFVRIITRIRHDPLSWKKFMIVQRYRIIQFSWGYIFFFSTILPNNCCFRFGANNLEIKKIQKKTIFVVIFLLRLPLLNLEKIWSISVNNVFFLV